MGRSFNGTSDLIAVDAAHVTNGSVSFTIATWVNSSLANANAKNPYGEGNTAGLGPFFQIQGDASGHVLVSARDTAAGGSDQISGTIVAFDSTWHHVCVSQTGASDIFRLFVDGTADGTKTRTSLSSATNQVFNRTTWGALVRNGTAQFYGGLLAHAALWTRELSAAEISSLAKGMLPSLLAPDHYWPFWGTDSPEPDIGNHLATAGVNGTLTGTAAAAGPPTQKYLLRLRQGGWGEASSAGS